MSAAAISSKAPRSPPAPRRSLLPPPGRRRSRRRPTSRRPCPARCRSRPRLHPPTPSSVTQTTSGGDFMVDVFKALDIDYLAMNCASSFRGLHEAVLNRGGNVKPEILTCTHEEIAVAHGAGLRQDRRQADRHDLPRRGRPAARHHGDVQCLVRPRAGDRVRRQHHRGQQARARAPSGCTRRSIRARWCATSPSGTTSRPRCSTSPSRSRAPTRSRPPRRWGR